MRPSKKSSRPLNPGQAHRQMHHRPRHPRPQRHAHPQFNAQPLPPPSPPSLPWPVGRQPSQQQGKQHPHLLAPSTPRPQSPLPGPPTPHAPPAPYSEAIHIQLHSGSAQVHIRWPTSAAAQCVQWMREGLAPLWQPAPTHHHLADNLPPDKPPPDGDALPHSSRPASPAARVAR